jgi:hypothetical protein
MRCCKFEADAHLLSLFQHANPDPLLPCQCWRVSHPLSLSGRTAVPGDPSIHLLHRRNGHLAAEPMPTGLPGYSSSVAVAICRGHSSRQASRALTQLQRLLHPVKPRTGSLALLSSPSDSLYHQDNMRREKLELANTPKTQPRTCPCALWALILLQHLLRCRTFCLLGPSFPPKRTVSRS